MTHKTSRRNFLKKSTIGSSVLLFPEVLFGLDSGENDFKMIDYHVHLTDTFTIEKAVELSKNINVKFGIVEHPWKASSIVDDKGLETYITRLRQYPVYIGIQPIYRNWSQNFSTHLIKQLDFILMDADTIPLCDGQYLEIWRHNNYIEDIRKFMGIYMEHIEDILKNESITIFARPTYLPVNFARYYDEIWTEERMMKIITLAKEKNIALEISTPMHVPSMKFINLAKANGIKFTMGTNARNSDAGKLHYATRMIKECKLSPDDFLMIG